jgi:rod shape-determining protein MreB and related proteins
VHLVANFAIDLGTANTLIYVKGKGIVYNEATAIAYDQRTNSVIAYGNTAFDMIGRTPPTIRVVRPLSTGVISDFAAARTFLQIVVSENVSTSRFRPLRAVIGVPSRISGAEFKTLQDALDTNSLAKVYAVQEPVAAAIGAGLSFSEPRGCLVIDVGAGTTDIAMLSLGRVVESRSLRIGGDALVAAFTNHMKNELRINVGDRTAETFMREYGMAFKVEKKKGVIAGVDMKTGLPVHVDITSDQVMNAIREPVSLIVSELRRLLDSVPPDLAADALEDGLNLTGGGSLLNGLAELLYDQTGIQCSYVDDPLTSVALGCGAIIEDLDMYKFVLESLPDEIAGMA